MPPKAAASETKIVLPCIGCPGSAELPLDYRFDELLKLTTEVLEFPGGSKALAKFQLLELLTGIPAGVLAAAEVPADPALQRVGSRMRKAGATLPADAAPALAAAQAYKPRTSIFPLVYMHNGALKCICSVECIVKCKSSDIPEGDKCLVDFRGARSGADFERLISKHNLEQLSWNSKIPAESVSAVAADLMREAYNLTPPTGAAAHPRVRSQFAIQRTPGAITQAVEDRLVTIMQATDEIETVYLSYVKHTAKTDAEIQQLPIHTHYSNWFRKKHSLAVGAPVPVPTRPPRQSAAARRVPPAVMPKFRSIQGTEVGVGASFQSTLQNPVAHHARSLPGSPVNVLPRTALSLPGSPLPPPVSLRTTVGTQTRPLRPPLPMRPISPDPVKIAEYIQQGYNAGEAAAVARLVALQQQLEAKKALVAELRGQVIAWSSDLREQQRLAQANAAQLQAEIGRLTLELAQALSSGAASATLRDQAAAAGDQAEQSALMVEVALDEVGPAVGGAPAQNAELERLRRILQNIAAELPAPPPQARPRRPLGMNWRWRNAPHTHDELTPLTSVTTTTGPAIDFDGIQARVKALVAQLARSERCRRWGTGLAILFFCIAFAEAMMLIFHCKLLGWDCPVDTNTTSTTCAPPIVPPVYNASCFGVPSRWIGSLNSTQALQWGGDVMRGVVDHSNLGNHTSYGDFERWMFECFATNPAVAYVFQQWPIVFKFAMAIPRFAELMLSNHGLLLLVMVIDVMTNSTNTTNAGENPSALAWHPHNATNPF